MSEQKPRQEIEVVIKGSHEIGTALNTIRDLIIRGLKGGTVVARMGRVGRSLSQNRKLWPMLTDVARQRELVINGFPVKARPEDWKDVFTASLRHEQRVALGIDGTPVFLGLHTSRMNKQEFSDLIELIYAYGAEHKIRWSEKSLAHFDRYRPAERQGIEYEHHNQQQQHQNQGGQPA